MMERSNRHHIRMVVEITHDYYRGDAVPVELIPDLCTQLQMSREGVLLKKQKGNGWLLLQSGEIPVDHQEGNFVFDLFITSASFHYVTVEEQSGKDYTYGSPSRPGSWKSLILSVPYTGEIKEVNVHLSGRSKFLEFLCIPRYTAPACRLRLAERTQSLACSGPEPWMLFGYTPAFRFVTSQEVLLRSRHTLCFSLWEVMKAGERLLTRDLPLPATDSFSPVSPKDTLTTYFYF
ncbi:MAG: hypothetical protein LIP08_04380 [Bacteroides sp.]|nr:hypothetical protein [Bacteroides sp.]